MPERKYRIKKNRLDLSFLQGFAIEDEGIRTVFNEDGSLYGTADPRQDGKAVGVN